MEELLNRDSFIYEEGEPLPMTGSQLTNISYADPAEAETIRLEQKEASEYFTDH